MKSSQRPTGDDSLFAANLVALGTAPAAPPVPLAPEVQAPPATPSSLGAFPLQTFADMSLDDALDELAAVHAFIARVQPELNAAKKAAADLEAVAHLRLTERGARVYDGARLRCRYEARKSGSASVPFPDALRKELDALNAAAIAENRPPIIPAAELDEALPYVTPPPVVKPDLRKTRKLADRGDVVRVVVTRHIVEAKKFDALVIEPIEINVSPSPPALPS